MAEDFNRHPDPESNVVTTSVFGPAIIKPDRSNSQLEDTLSLSFAAEHAKNRKQENEKNEGPVKTPPEKLPNGEVVSGGSSATLSIPKPVFPDGSAAVKERSAANKPIAFSDEMTAEIRSSGTTSNTRTYKTVLPYTSPFGPSGLAASRNVRSASAPTSTLEIPEAVIDTGTIYHAYGEDATDKSLNGEEVLLRDMSKPISEGARFTLFDSLNEEEERKKQKERVLPKRSDRNHGGKAPVLSATPPASDDKTVISFTGKYRTSDLASEPHDTVNLTAKQVAEAEVIQFPTSEITIKELEIPDPSPISKKRKEPGIVEVPDLSDAAEAKDTDQRETEAKEEKKPESRKKDGSSLAIETEPTKSEVQPAVKPAVREEVKPEPEKKETPAVTVFEPVSQTPLQKSVEETTAISFTSSVKSSAIQAETKPEKKEAQKPEVLTEKTGAPERKTAPEKPETEPAVKPAVTVPKPEPVKKETPVVTYFKPVTKNTAQKAAEETIAIPFPARDLSSEKNRPEVPAVIQPKTKKEETKPAPAVIKAEMPAVDLNHGKAVEETIAISFPAGSLSSEKNKPETPAVIKPKTKKEETKPAPAVIKTEPANPQTKKAETKKPEAVSLTAAKSDAVKTRPKKAEPAKTETGTASVKPAEAVRKESPFQKISSYLINTFTEPVQEEEQPVKKPVPVHTAAPADSGETMVIPVITKEIAEAAKTPEKKKIHTAENRTASNGGSGGSVPPSSSPKSVKEPPRRRNGFLTVITIVLIIGILCELITGVVGLSIVGKMIRNSPDLSLTDFVGEESSKIYDDQDKLVTEVGVYLRENITYDKCPEALVDAFLAVEDSRFFSHFGFDIPRFTKAAIDNLKTHSFGQGGSTFTMQLVKNTYFSIDSMNASETGTERTRSIEYKVQQIYLAIKLENLLSKKEIFQLYLNKLNFGGNIRGVQRAAQYYFGKNCNELNLSEAAMLAGIVNLPNRYNPYEFLDYGTKRRDQVLDLMNYHGYINDSEFSLAKAIKLEDTLVGDHRKAVEDSQYQSYLDAVLEEAMKLTGCDPTVKGMKIYTHLNRSMQETVESIQNGETNVVYPDDLMQVAMVSMDNRTGAVIAIGGGRNYDGARLLNRATMNYKQPGSSVKPLLSYGLAYEYLGYTLDEVLIDKPITYPMESMVLVNADGNYHGDVTIKDALGNSLNIPAIITLERVVRHIGREKVVEYLQKIGFSRITLDNFNYSYAIGGTSFETTCMELAGAHSMLINGGVYNQPHTIKKVVMTIDGSEFYPTNTNVRALSSGSAYLITVLEENNVSGPYFNWMQILKRDYPVYAKTGTTDWGKDGMQYGIPEGQMKDKWMVASTSQYTNCVWVGYDMAVAGKETYYTSYKSNLNIPGNINKLLLDKEEQIYGVPDAIQEPSDIEDVTYIYGSFPHVRSEYAQGGGTATSKASRAGLESMPLATTKEYQEYRKEEAKLIGLSGMSASYNQMGVLTVSWGNAGGACANGQKDISLHDEWNDISMWGACLADLSWLSGATGSYWGTVYCDDIAVGQFTSDSGIYTGYVADLYGTVKVCGGSVAASENGSTGSCVVAVYNETSDLSGYLDENGNWVSTPDYSQYGHWDDQGNWIGQGWWDENGFHH